MPNPSESTNQTDKEYLENWLKKEAENVPEEEEKPVDNEAYEEQPEDIDPTQADTDTETTGPDQSEDQKRKSCKQVIKLGDQGQQALFTWLYRRAYFSDRQWERITKSDLSKKNPSDLEDQEDIQLQQLYQQFTNQIEKLPLTDEEIQDLTDHAKEAMEYLEKQPPSPVTSLVIAVLTTLGVRALPLLSTNQNG